MVKKRMARSHDNKEPRGASSGRMVVGRIEATPHSSRMTPEDISVVKSLIRENIKIIEEYTREPRFR
jgi:hypothetical protein